MHSAMAFRFSFPALVFFIICLMFVKIESDEPPQHMISLQSACDVTLDPKFCVSTMSSLLPGSMKASSTDLARMALRLSITEAQKVSQIISGLEPWAFKGIQLGQNINHRNS